MPDTKAPAPGSPAKPALKPANENPWYILMTLHGEQPEGATFHDLDEELHAKNLNRWNRWLEPPGTELRRQLPDGSFSMTILETEFEEACKKRGVLIALPKPSKKIEFTNTHFVRSLNAKSLTEKEVE